MELLATGYRRPLFLLDVLTDAQKIKHLTKNPLEHLRGLR